MNVTQGQTAFGANPYDVGRFVRWYVDMYRSVAAGITHVGKPYVETEVYFSVSAGFIDLYGRVDLAVAGKEVSVGHILFNEWVHREKAGEADRYFVEILRAGVRHRAGNGCLHPMVTEAVESWCNGKLTELDLTSDDLGDADESRQKGTPWYGPL